jgi:hypothetical protein
MCKFGETRHESTTKIALGNHFGCHHMFGSESPTHTTHSATSRERYAMARAGSSLCDPMTFMPNDNGISPTYFDQYNWSERDNAEHGLTEHDIICWTGHAAYVLAAPRDGNQAVIVDQIHVAHTAYSALEAWPDDDLPTARTRLGGDLGTPSCFWKRKQVSWTVENDFHAGTVKIDGVEHPSGTDTADWWSSLPLLAINQDYQSIYRVWNDWEGNTQNPFYTIAGSGDLHHANFTRWCDMTFSNSLPGISGGTITVWDTLRNAGAPVRIPYGNTFHAIAVDQDHDHIWYIFTQWSDGSSIPRDRTIFNPIQHGNYTAQFTTKPFAPDTLRQIAAIGQYVHLTWGDNPNSRVTKYHIYRTAPSIPEAKHLVDSVSSGVQSWYDYEVIVKARGMVRNMCTMSVESTIRRQLRDMRLLRTNSASQ